MFREPYSLTVLYVLIIILLIAILPLIDKGHSDVGDLMMIADLKCPIHPSPTSM